MKIKLKLLQLSVLTMLSAVFIIACQNQNDVSPANNQTGTTVVTKSQIIATTQDVLSITSDALSGESVSVGRLSTVMMRRPHWAHYDSCRPVITRGHPKITHTDDTTSYHGCVTVDYGHGGNCGGGSTKLPKHKGKIIDNFTFTILGDSTLIETDSITFSGCSHDSTQVDGVIISRTSNGITTVSLKNVKLTYHDGSSVTWTGTLTYTYGNGGTQHDLRDDTTTVTGAISGTSDAGVNYTNTITTPIVYKYSCLGSNIVTPVSGAIEVRAGSGTSTIDYGNGACDNTYTVTTNGVTTSHTF